MVRIANTKNESYYHYFVTTINKTDDVPIKTVDYYLTQKDIMEKYSISRTSVLNKLKKPTRVMRYEKENDIEIRFNKCYIPTQHRREVNREELDMIRKQLYE